MFNARIGPDRSCLTPSLLALGAPVVTADTAAPMILLNRLGQKIPHLLIFSFAADTTRPRNAGVAQLVEQLICNHQVVSSSLITGSSKYGHSSQILECPM